MAGIPASGSESTRFFFAVLCFGRFLVQSQKHLSREINLNTFCFTRNQHSSMVALHWAIGRCQGNSFDGWASHLFHVEHYFTWTV